DLLPPQNRQEVANDLNHARADDDDENRGEDKQDHYGDHLDWQFRSVFSSALLALHTQRVREDPQRLSDAGAELVRLNEDGYQSLHVFTVGPLRQIPECFVAAPAHIDFNVTQLELFREVWMGIAQFRRDPNKSQVQSKSRLHAHNRKIERVRNCELDPFPAG